MSGPTTSSRTDAGRRAFRMLCVSTSSPALPGDRGGSAARSDDVLHCLTDLFVEHGPPSTSSDNGPEFAAKAVRSRQARREDAVHRARQSLENGYCESFNSKLRDELLNGEIFTTLREAQVLIENWRRHYNAVRPHSSLGYRPPAPEAILPPACGLPYAPLRSAYRLANAAGL